MTKLAYVFLAGLTFAPVAVIGATAAYAEPAPTIFEFIGSPYQYQRGIQSPSPAPYYRSSLERRSAYRELRGPAGVAMIDDVEETNVCDRAGRSGFEQVSGSERGSCVVSR